MQAGSQLLLIRRRGDASGCCLVLALGALPSLRPRTPCTHPHRSTANLMGYLKCSKAAQSQIKGEPWGQLRRLPTLARMAHTALQLGTACCFRCPALTPPLPSAACCAPLQASSTRSLPAACAHTCLADREAHASTPRRSCDDALQVYTPSLVPVSLHPHCSLCAPLSSNASILWPLKLSWVRSARPAPPLLRHGHERGLSGRHRDRTHG